MGYESDPLPSYIWISNHSYTICFKIQSYPGHSTSRPMSWSHHLINLIDTGILFSPIQILYMVCQSTCTAMSAWFHWMFSLIGQIPAVSSTSATGRHSHSTTVVRQAVFPAILLAALWWNPSSIFNIDPVNTYIFLLYSSTFLVTAL